MRARWSSQWGWRVCAVLLLVGGLVFGTGTVVTQAWERDDDHQGKNPFDRILHKLDQILGKVGRTVDLCHGGSFVGRFVVNGGEVCDRTTGLTWEQQPNPAFQTPGEAVAYCQNKGNHSRLPEVKELLSLVDYSQDNPVLPVGHPFIGIQLAFYWSATTLAGDSGIVRAVNFESGSVNPTVLHGRGGSTPYLLVWCVRGA